jgi:hypothetical protein
MWLGPESPDAIVGLASTLPTIVVVHGSDNHLFDSLHNARWASHATETTVQDLGIDHGGAHFLMAQQVPG